MPEPDLRIDETARSVIGAALEVHRALGPGFLEAVYEEALALELALRGVPHQRQAPIPVHYKGACVGEARPDFLVDGHLIVELKAVGQVLPVHRAQVLSYLRAAGKPLGLLLNFNAVLLREGTERIVRTSA